MTHNPTNFRQVQIGSQEPEEGENGERKEEAIINLINIGKADNNDDDNPC
jgi:hypothetical protein